MEPWGKGVEPEACVIREMSGPSLGPTAAAQSQVTDMEAPSQGVSEVCHDARLSTKALSTAHPQWATLKPKTVRRRLRRNSSRFGEIDVKSVMAIKGGVMMDYMILPTETILSTESVQIGNGRRAPGLH